jgi:hypothetical protein
MEVGMAKEGENKGDDEECVAGYDPLEDRTHFIGRLDQQ